ncbi:MAG TPA: peptide deformylase [Atribacteraceae bacterium]|nr:peptide deformylase [Atribacteraceae bacterium]
MNRRKILTYGHKLLREKALPVSVANGSVIDMLDDMKTTMHSSAGIGLAGNQVGIMLRLITLIHPDTRETLSLINPEVVDCGEETEQAEEGCLSVPDIFCKVERPRKVTVRALTPSGNVLELTGENLLARILLHEIDHLNGVLFVDRLNPIRRLLVSNKLKKFSVAGEYYQ